MFLAEIFELVSTNYTSTTGLHREVIGYAYFHQIYPYTYKKRDRRSQDCVFCTILYLIAHDTRGDY